MKKLWTSKFISSISNYLLISVVHKLQISSYYNWMIGLLCIPNLQVWWQTIIITYLIFLLFVCWYPSLSISQFIWGIFNANKSQVPLHGKTGWWRRSLQTPRRGYDWELSQLCSFIETWVPSTWWLLGIFSKNVPTIYAAEISSRQFSARRHTQKWENWWGIRLTKWLFRSQYLDKCYHKCSQDTASFAPET